MPKDELGVEYDETVAEALKDPKSSVLKGVLDYFIRRKVVEDELDRKKKEQEDHDKKPKGPFGKIFG